MAQATANSTELSDGTTFLEFCNRCCERCRVVRWIGVDNPLYVPALGDDREDEPNEKSPWSPSCPLCQQLRHMFPLDFEKASVLLGLERLNTVAVQDPWYRSDDERPYDVLYVRFSSEGYMSPERKLTFVKFALADMPGARQYKVQAESIEPFVNWKAVRKWIGHCEATHGSCERLSDGLPIPGLKIIDCETGVVEPFLDNAAPYVALSYVWGESQDDQKDYPQTVLDSMQAVLALGLRYLWVDRICIDQKDSIHKLAQIGMMDQIYLGAYLTIISCSDDAEQGLPGMCKLPRDSQRLLWLGDYMLKDIYRPSESVQQSRWITRGWTYQEGFMSRRKLFFTGQGVALWCGSMYYEEGISRDISDIDKVREDLVPGSMQLVAPSSLSVDRLGEVILHYTMRRLTYEDDALNACLGIFNYLGYKHLWGIVIREQPFSLELCWIVLDDGAPEQEAFPSWSWTRWRSIVRLQPQSYPSSIASIKTHLPNGEELDVLRDTHYKGNLGAVCSGKILRITGTFPMFFVGGDNNSVHCHSIFLCACGADIKMPIHLDMGTGSIASTTAHLDGTELLEVMPLHKDAEERFSGHFLLVKRHMDAYRRVGLVYIDGDYSLVHSGAPKHFEVGIIPMKGCYTKTIDLI